MNSYKYQPLQGLLKLRKEDYRSISLLKTLEKVEEEISPAPRGRARRLMLFFYIIDILRSNDVSFYVKGGIILQYYLKDHSRDTKDIDVLISDADIFYDQAQKAFENNAYGLDIKITRFEKVETNEKYYFPTFYMDVSISIDGEEIDVIFLEGICCDLFNKVSPKEYIGPSIIKENFSYLGVPIEYVFADKVLAITSELDRPYKHLVDAYSISQIDINIKEVKKYLDIVLSFENIKRKELGMSTGEYKYEIKPSKKFTHGYLFTVIQAGYTLSADKMIQEMNRYMSKNLK